MKREFAEVIKDYFLNKIGIELVYLYGSQAKGKARKDSDIDLGVYIDKKREDIDIQLTAMNELSTILHKEGI